MKLIAAWTWAAWCVRIQVRPSNREANMARREKPEILQMSALDESLGHCSAGYTPTSDSCGYGEETLSPDHSCQDGDYAGAGGGWSYGEYPFVD